MLFQNFQKKMLFQNFQKFVVHLCHPSESIDYNTLDEAISCSEEEFTQGLEYLCNIDATGRPTNTDGNAQIRLTDSNFVAGRGLTCTGKPYACADNGPGPDCGGDCIIANDIYFDDVNEVIEFRTELSTFTEIKCMLKFFPIYRNWKLWQKLKLGQSLI